MTTIIHDHNEAFFIGMAHRFGSKPIIVRCVSTGADRTSDHIALLCLGCGEEQELPESSITEILPLTLENLRKIRENSRSCSSNVAIQQIWKIVDTDSKGARFTARLQFFGCWRAGRHWRRGFVHLVSRVKRL